MEFAKLRSDAKYNLATSGVMNYPLAALPVSLRDLEVNGPTIYGYAPLQERLARYNDVPPECVVAATGTSMANHLAMAATFEPGDEVLIEHPTYELLVSTAQYLGAEVRYFERRFEEGFRIDPGEVAKQISPHTRLVLLTNLHNPSGAYTDQETLRAVGEVAKQSDARVLVDEVYLELFFGDRSPSAVHLGEHFLVTSSLTKAFGLSGLRCGWVLASPELAERMWHINDLYGAIPAHAAELLSVIALDHLDRVAARGREVVAQNRRALDALLNARSDIASFRPERSTIAFPKLLSGRMDEFYRLLREKYETSVVPGCYFDMSQHFRIGIGGDPEMTAEGLRRLGLALEELQT
jgi:aspartate/methionine/tyrosine aminotransferase